MKARKRRHHQFGYTSTYLPTYVTPAHTGGLPAENIQFTYDRFGQPQSTRGVNTIVAGSTYSSAGEPLRYALGGLDQVALTFDRDTHTHRVNQITMTCPPRPGVTPATTTSTPSPPAGLTTRFPSWKVSRGH